ncbi:hypothetical protein IR132_01365 [Micrococcus yunnanensis]|uniref:hypothetical protein n=1 Tax=Micrococcus yunnanensis TaxID=566027 RepID=UPI001071B883|nr:hypothetical protein [Micrococcus yunnanensis]MBF0744107.1 hypothetical protein [Micrococcus yunnanensis]TFU55983.1 hypothetical protein E4T95_01360 [Micrococcus yunnanensis]
MHLDVVYIRPGGSGWGPVEDLARLTARTLGGTLIEVADAGAASVWQRGAVLLPRGRRGHGRHLLVIAGNPAALALAARRELWWPGYESTAAWVIDSFWTDRIAGIVRHRPHVDRLFITDPDLVDEWAGLTGRPVDVLPWGSDTMAFPDVAEDKPVDLQRLGRQPKSWDDDDVTGAEARAHSLTFAGRPPQSMDPAENQATVRQALLASRLVLAFSNRVSPAAYTHPTREYLTGRWTDALAAGCLVAGTAPATAQTLLWPGATLEVSPSDRSTAWPVLGEAAGRWDSSRAREQQHRARRTLDWRWRLRDLCRAMGWEAAGARVDAALERLGS